MNAKHTPGPWTVAEHHGAIDVMGVGSGVCRVFTDPNQNGLPTMPGARANARLIAAAPDLLAACEALLAAAVEPCEPREDVIEWARAAIARATMRGTPEGRDAASAASAGGGAK